MIHPGTQERMISETTIGAGTTIKRGVIQSDSLLASLYVDSVTTGNLSVSIYTEIDDGKEVLLFTFPTITAPSSALLLKKSGASMARFRIAATYTGICSYTVYVRAIMTAGESSTKVLGANEWEVSSETVTTSAAILIPSALVDRAGLIIKNANTTGILYLAESLVKATTADGYPLNPGENLAMDLAGGAEVYAIGSTTIDVRIAQAGS